VVAGDPELDVWWMRRSGDFVTFSHPSTRLLDLLGVKHVVSPDPLQDPGLRVEQAVDECDRTTDSITRDRPVSGHLRVWDTAINRIDLLFNLPEDEQNLVDLKVRLWQDSDRDRLMLEAEVAAVDVMEQPRSTLYFAPERDAPGQEYRWEVSTTATDSHIRVCLDQDSQPALAFFGSDWVEVYQDEVHIFERLAPLPRSYVVYAAEYIDGDDATVERLLDEGFPVRHKAVTGEPISLPNSSDLPASAAEVIEYENTRVVVRASAVREGLLILGDQFYPGWKAMVDGRPTSIIRTNHILRGVLLPPGEHTIVFEFHPAMFRTGSWLTVAGFILLASFFILDRRGIARQWIRNDRN